MSSNLKVNTILPSSGNTVAVSGIASVTSSVSIASSCTATTFYGSGANLTGISGVTINNNANNRIITGSGSANTLEGESSLTYDGNGLLNITGTGAAGVFVITPSNTDGGIYFNDGSNSGAVTYLHTNNTLSFRVGGQNKVKIDNSGNLNLN